MIFIICPGELQLRTPTIHLGVRMLTFKAQACVPRVSLLRVLRVSGPEELPKP